MDKQEVLTQHILQRYEGIDKLIYDDAFNEEDVRDYIRFQDSDRTSYKGYQNWLSFKGIAKKIKKSGIESVLMREDVEGTSVAVEGLENWGGYVKYIVVKTKYGEIWVTNGRQIAYMR